MATAQTARPEETHHYLWWFPGSPVRVRLDLGVVEKLKNRLCNSGSEQVHPQEGLLFGEIRNGATEILGFEPASTGSVGRLIETLPVEKKGSLIGYYRTESGEALKLNAEDHSLAKEHFARPYNVILLVHRNNFGPPAATFFFHDSNGAIVDFAFMEFPFDPSLLASEQDGRIRRTQQAQPFALPPPPSSATSPPSSKSRPDSLPSETDQPGGRRRLSLNIVAFTCLLTAAAGIALSSNRDSFRQGYSAFWHAVAGPPSASRPSSKSAPHPSVSLRAIRENGFLALTWNRESDLITAATVGALSIRDGDSPRLISLDAAQLRDGSLLYVPRTDQILIQLSLTSASETYKESVTVILPSVGEPATIPAPMSKVEASSLPVAAEKSGEAAAIQPVKAFYAPTLSKDPPARKDSSTIAMYISNVAGSPTSDAVAPPVGSLPKSPLATPVIYEPAVPLVKTEPKLPEELRPLTKKTIVQVNLAIDNNGKVIQAEAISERGVSQLLLNSVLEASRSWKFKPALNNRQAVSSESKLTFVFNP